MALHRAWWLVAVCLLAVCATLAAEECEDGADCEDGKSDKHSAFRSLMPLSVYDWAGFGSIGLFTAIAAGGGIGGGGVLVPLLILVMGFAIKSAIPLSNITILGGSIFHIIRNLNRRHPAADRPLIDWNFICLMQPMLIAGAVIGSFVNKVVADWFLAVFLFVILILTARRTWSNGMKQWAKEEQAAKQEKEQGLLSRLDSPPSAVPLVERGGEELSPELASILEADRRMPVGKILVISMVFVGVLALNVLKGAPGASGGHQFNLLHIECGSMEFWVISLAVIPWCLFGFFITRFLLVAQYHGKVAAGYEFLEGDIEWDEARTAKLPLVCLGAGVMAGMFGIGAAGQRACGLTGLAGGGLINGPLMVELGVLPDVASATSATMILFTSSTATVCYVLFNILNFEYATVLFPLGFGATLIGQFVFNKVMDIWQRKSLVVFVIAFIVGCSAVLMGIEGGFTFIEYLEGEGTLFHPICQPVGHPIKEITINRIDGTHN